MTFDEYLTEVDFVQRQYPEWRKGQTYFNVLYKHRPDLSESIRATSFDPFYADAAIPKFLEAVKSVWDR